MLRLDGLTKHFGETIAVADLSLVVEVGEFITLLGPSGCGKTTTLRMVAGFEQPSAGRIRLDGRDVTGLSPQRRDVGMVFQNYALFPHLDVFENVAFGLKARGTDKNEVPRRVEEALELVDLPGYGGRPVQALSGGQQQRVALARALAPEPPVLLLDEPLSNLDAALRERTRDELRALLKRLGITAVFVTHDQEEAFALSDRIAVLEGGRLQQTGTPEALYDAPATAFVASFLGRANFLPAKLLRAEGDAAACELAGGTRWRARLSAGAAARGDTVEIMIRPEALRMLSAADVAREPGDLTGRVAGRRFAGAWTQYRIETEPGEVLVLAAAGAARPGAEVVVRLDAEARPLAFAPVPSG